MQHNFIFSTLIYFLVLSTCKESSLYDILGVSKSATLSDIKRAYRSRARDTHPDKNPNTDPEVAAKTFREVVDAYETLSDENSRRDYDRTGTTSSQRSQSRGGPGSAGHDGNGPWWWWNSNFQRNQQHGKRYHRYLFDPYYRAQIMDAQSRVINVHSLHHFNTVITPSDDSDVLDRYVLLAFYDSSIQGCEDKLQLEILYPWPFAGFSRDGGEGMWWDEIMLTAKVDLKGDGSEGNLKTLSEKFGVRGGALSAQTCPSIAFMPRGGSVHDIYKALYFPTSEDFRNYVWSQLKMTVTFINKTRWTLQYWWLDGFRGNAQKDIPAKESMKVSTFLSHSFFFRASIVDGFLLNNESGLLWYTARIQDDNSVVEIKPKCFDHHSDCKRWSQEGFCDPNSNTFYVRRNPEWAQWVGENCFISCQVGCGRPFTASTTGTSAGTGSRSREL